MQSTFFLKDNVMLFRQDGSSVPAQTALHGVRYVLVYFSAQWCSPCRAFTPLLKAFHASHHHSESFEVIFVSLDNSDAEMQAYFTEAHGDYYRLSFGDAKVLAAERAKMYGIHTIPALLLFENTTPRKLLVRDARRILAKDASAQYFPWSTYENPVARARM